MSLSDGATVFMYVHVCTCQEMHSTLGWIWQAFWSLFQPLFSCRYGCCDLLRDTVFMLNCLRYEKWAMYFYDFLLWLAQRHSDYILLQFMLNCLMYMRNELQWSRCYSSQHVSVVPIYMTTDSDIFTTNCRLATNGGLLQWWNTTSFSCYDVDMELLCTLTLIDIATSFDFLSVFIPTTLWQLCTSDW